jgi:hypothetical protein
MNNALTIQFIIVPILKSYPDRSKYTSIMTVTFLITMVFYYYINGVGAYGTNLTLLSHRQQTVTRRSGDG